MRGNQNENAYRSTGVLTAKAKASPSCNLVRRSGPEKTTILEKRIECVFQRILPHTIQKTLDKVDRMLHPQLAVRINGRSTTISATEHLRFANKTHTLAITFAQSLGSPVLHDGGALSTLIYVDLEITSARSLSSQVYWKSERLHLKSWKRVVSNERLGISMYTLAVGPWNSSCIVAIVWTRTLEILQLHLLSHRIESLYHACHRRVLVICDDIDPKYGLHSYTLCIAVRNLSDVLWERDFYDVEFQAPLEKDSNTVTARLIQDQVLPAEL